MKRRVGLVSLITCALAACSGGGEEMRGPAAGDAPRADDQDTPRDAAPAQSMTLSEGTVPSLRDTDCAEPAPRGAPWSSAPGMSPAAGPRISSSPPEQAATAQAIRESNPTRRFMETSECET